MRTSPRITRSAIAVGTLGVVAAVSLAVNPFATAATFTNVSASSAPVADYSAPVADYSAPVADYSAPIAIDDYTAGWQDGYAAGYADGSGYGYELDGDWDVSYDDSYVPTVEENAANVAWEVVAAQVSGDRDYAEAVVRSYGSQDFIEAFVASPEFNLITGADVDLDYFYLDDPSIVGDNATFLIHRVRTDGSENLNRITIDLASGTIVGSDFTGVGSF